MAGDLKKELLTVCRQKLELGDTFYSVHQFLKNSAADDELIKEIIRELDEEDKAEKTKSANQTGDSPYFNLAFGLCFGLTGLLMLTGALSKIFPDLDPTQGTRLGKLGKVLFLFFVDMEGTIIGYLIAIGLIYAGYRLIKSFVLGIRS